MSSSLKLVVEALSRPPFSKNYSIIQLHDELPVVNLLQLITDCAAAIEDGNVPGQSIHRVDVRNEEPEATVWRIGDLLRVLKYKDAGSIDALRQRLQGEDRMLLLDILHFLLKDMQSHKMRVYLAQFLEIVDIPSEFLHDDVIRDLSEQVAVLQEQFKEIHQYVETLRQNGKANAATNLKREIQMMEEEKQQVMAKIARIKKKVQEIPNHDIWLNAARSLRAEQQLEATISEKIKEQRVAVSAAEKKQTDLQRTLKEVKTVLSSASPETLLAKMEEDTKMNKYLATENLPKAVEEANQKIRLLNRVISEPPTSDHELAAIDAEIRELSDQTAALAEKRLLKNNSGGDKLALFRQQAAIIARKKEGTAQRLNALSEEVNRLREEIEKKTEATKGTSSGVKMPKGEDFKRYVSELRGKSNVYKRKKAELGELTGEFGILQRTEEILSGRVRELEKTRDELERKVGVLGYHDARDNLEKVSERKSELDENKGKTLNEISDIIQTVIATINDKKAMLAPVIQELRNVRAEATEVESDYLEKKRHFDATMVGIDSEISQIENEIKGYRQDIATDQSRYHHLQSMISNAEASQERVLHEMKAYIGGDEQIEAIQKARGFRTYRDAYNRRILEQENLGKNLREQQKDIKTRYEPSVKQMALFSDVKKLLELKVIYNRNLLAGGGGIDPGFEGKMTQDRLVL